MTHPDDQPEWYSQRVYLGDGVYAHHDGYMLWLRTPRESGWHEIALEPDVLRAFDEYRERLAARAKETT